MHQGRLAVPPQRTLLSGQAAAGGSQSEGGWHEAQDLRWFGRIFLHSGHLLGRLHRLLDLLLCSVQLGLDRPHFRINRAPYIRNSLAKRAERVTQALTETLHVLRRGGRTLVGLGFQGSLLSLLSGDGILVHDGRRAFRRRLGLSRRRQWWIGAARRRDPGITLFHAHRLRRLAGLDRLSRLPDRRARTWRLRRLRPESSGHNCCRGPWGHLRSRLVGGRGVALGLLSRGLWVRRHLRLSNRR